MAKPWVKSRTVWFNTLATTGALLEANVSILPPEWQPVALGIFALVNILLRMDTDTPITSRKGSE